MSPLLIPILDGETLLDGDVMRTSRVDGPALGGGYYRPATWKSVKDNPMTAEHDTEFLCRAADGTIYTQKGSSNLWSNVITHYLCELPAFTPPKSRIETLMEENNISEDDVKIAAFLARGTRIWGPTDFVIAKHKVSGDDGRLTFGCQSFTWEEISEYATKKGMW